MARSAAEQLVVSVVIPAHDEQASIPGLLRRLHVPGVELVVVANGCSDRTADAARQACPSATVLEIAEASKTAALREGDRSAHVFPRFYLDADVEIEPAGLLRLADLLRDPRILAVAPTVHFHTAAASWLVRSFYRVLPLLAPVSNSIAGTGCMGVSAEGRARFGDWPSVLADDYFLDGCFTAEEKRRAPEATVVVRTPVGLRDLVRRRERVIWANRQVEDLGLRRPGGRPGSGLLALAAHHPRRMGDIAVFVAVGLIVRLRVLVRRARGLEVGWNRDASRERR